MHPFLDRPTPYAIAHRGGAADGIENTLASFARAVELGYDVLETDVWSTSDGVLVAFHDPDLARVGAGRGRIRDMTWRELSGIRVGGREPIPRFEEVLSVFANARFVVEPKCDAAVDPLITALRASDALHRVCVGSFSDRRLRRVREALGDAVCTSMGPREVLRLRLAAWRLAPRSIVPFRADCVQIPRWHGVIPVAERRLIAYAQAHGLPVHVWTVNDQATMEHLLTLGVDGIVTDEIELLRQVLRERGQWHGH